jgi:hypothetical protein
MGFGVFQSDRNHVQLLYAIDDQRYCKVERQNWLFVCTQVLCFAHFKMPENTKANIWCSHNSFAGTGFVSVVIAWFLLPEVALRTPAEIDEM